jgi:hypothetical protein
MTALTLEHTSARTFVFALSERLPSTTVWEEQNRAEDKLFILEP